MADNQAQADPNANLSSTAPPATPTETPTDAASPSITQPTQPAPTEPQDAALANVDSGDAYAELLRQTLDTPEATQGEPAAPTEPTETTPADPNAPANETTTTEPPAGGDDKDTSDRIRLGGLTEKDRQLTHAAVLLAKAQGISVADAMARMTGTTPAAAAPDPAATQAPTNTTLPDPEAIRQRIATLETELDAAGDEADTVKIVKVNKELRKAERELVQAENAITQAVTTAKAQHLQGVNASRQKARDLYPALKDTTSPLSQRWMDVASRLEAAQDPLVTGNNPNFALVVAQMAAAELGIAPASSTPSKASPSSTTQPAQPTATRPVQPAPGSAKTTVPTATPGQLETRIASAKTEDDYLTLVRELQGVA